MAVFTWHAGAAAAAAAAARGRSEFLGENGGNFNKIFAVIWTERDGLRAVFHCVVAYGVVGVCVGGWAGVSFSVLVMVSGVLYDPGWLLSCGCAVRPYSW